MTLDKKLSKQIYKTNGNAVDFPFSFEVFEKDYISVTISNDADLVSSTQVLEILPEDVSLSENGGNVKIYFDRAKQSPYPEGYTIAITRNMPFLQLLSLIEGGAFHAKVIENSFDIIKAELRQLYEHLQRAVIIPVTSEEDPSVLLIKIFEAERKVLLAEENIVLKSEQVSAALQELEKAENSARQWAIGEIEENPEGSAKYWAQSISSGLPEANILQKGIVQRASDEIASVGIDEEKYINSKQLISEIRQATPQASVQERGLIRKASDAEVHEGLSEEGAINPKQYKENLPLAFEQGTRMLFQQAAAPSGWIKEEDSNYNNIALKVTTNSFSSIKGTEGFDSFFVANKNISISGSTGYTTLTVAQLASHNHSTNLSASPIDNGQYKAVSSSGNNLNGAPQSSHTGSNHGHAHSFSGASTLNFALKHCSVIICTKA